VKQQNKVVSVQCCKIFANNPLHRIPQYAIRYLYRTVCGGSDFWLGMVVSSVADPDPGSGIGCFLTPGSGIRDGRKSASGSGRIRDGDSSDPGSGMEKSRIRDPG
jgi:hypothetical protein